MKKYSSILLFFCFAVITNLDISAQETLFVDAGPDMTATCASGGCVNITASYQQTFETISEVYNVESIPYNPPFPFSGLANSLNPNIDDAWSNVDNLPFDFCFFGELKQQFQVGSNGVIRLDVDPSDTGVNSNAWPFTADLPNNAVEALAEANVFTPVHDIDPTESSTEEIGYEVIGTSPNRALVVSYFEVPMFSGSCNSLLATHMAVFYEYSNTIDIYIRDKPSCPTWNSGSAALGIQNDDGTIAYVPPGRNTSDSPWATNNEAWRFRPDGVETSSFEWVDDTGTVIGTTPTLNVCVSGPEVFTARVTYTNTCNGDIVVLEDTVSVTTTANFSVDLGPDIDTCDTSDIILNGDSGTPGFTYEWFRNGISQGPPTIDDTTFTVMAPNSDTYSVEVVDPADPTCVVGDSVNVNFRPQPVIASPPMDLFVCDNGSGSGDFDLTENDDDVLGAQDPAEFDNITYHTSQVDANSGNSPIPNPDMYSFTGTQLEIFVRIENNSGTCFATASFFIAYTQVSIGALTTLEICDDDGTVSLDLAMLKDDEALNGLDPLEYSVSYHASQADADTPSGAFPNPYNTSMSQTIFVRVENNVNPSCFITDTFTLDIFIAPSPNTNPSPLIICDDGSGMSCDTNTPNDGFGTFRLDDATLDITGGDPDLTVTYFGTRINAQNNQLPLPVDVGTGDVLYCNDNAYNDIPVTDVLDPLFGTGGVWARVDSATNNCFEIVPLSLIVRDLPEINTPSGPLRVCDDAVADGITTGIDLTQVELEVLGVLSPDEYDVYYYEDQLDAMLDGDAALASQPNPTFPRAIGMPDNFENASTPQTIYVLVVGNTMSTMPNNGTTGCYSIVSFELIVDPLPADNGPFELFECDQEFQDGVPTEMAFFDLTQLEAGAITNPNDVVTWFVNDPDGVSPNQILTPDNYENIATPQTVFGLVTTEFGCSQSFTVTLRVLPNPDANAPDPIEICDGDVIAGDMDPDDGIGFFDLTQRDAQIIGTATDVTLLYFETLQDAIDNVPGTELISPYENTTPDTQVVFARLTQDSPPATLACYSIVPLTLTVIPLPDQPDSSFQDPLRACDDDGDGIAEFDLTAQDTAVIGSQDPLDFVTPITYYTSLADAQIPDNEIDPALAMAYPSTTGQTIWVRLENSTTGCARVSSFMLEIDTPSAIGVGDDLFACDVDNGVDAPDGVGVFDLTVNEGLINQGDFTLNFVYYASAADQAADNPIPALEVESYENIVSPQQEIFVDVVNAQGCTAQTSFFINVETNPAAVSPMPIVACDENNDGIFDMFDLEDPDLITEIENGETDVVTSFYVSVVDAQTGDPLDVLPSPYENIVPFNQTIYARVERTVPPGVNPCYTIVAVALEVAQLPNEPTSDFQDPLSVCDDGDGSVFFDLSLNTAPILDAQDDPSIITVGYYPTEADAMAEPPTNEIMPDDAYESSGETVWVRVENTTTGCFRILNFELIVEPLPVLGTAPFELLACDDEVNGSTPDDGLATFDLTTANTTITDGNTSYAVFYYTSLANQAADNPISDPTSYQNLDAMGNIENPQDIFVTVQTAFGCEVETTLTLEVLPNPAAMTPDPFEICDGEGGPLDTNTSDGVSFFDLTTLDATIIAGQPNVNVLYYESLVLAEEAVVGTEIQNPTEYQNTTPEEQVIYARVTRDVPPARLGCFTIVEVVLRVNPLPDDSGIISDLIICELIFDGVATFNLDEKDEEALNGQDPSIFDVQYFLDQPNAEVGSSPIINSDSFSNTVNPQEIFVGILNTDTGCYIGGLQSFFIEVRQDAVANQPTEPFVICDNEGDPRDGFASFNLNDTSNEDVEALNAIILGSQSDLDFTITYHETLESAEAGSPSISFPYTNVINPQRIYIRVTHTTGCFATSSMILQVDPSPEVVLEESYRICVDADGNLIPEEDGDPSPPTIDTGLDPSQYTFAWEIDGELQVGEINPFIVAQVAGVYTVTVTDSINGCETTAETTVFMSSPPITFDAIVTSGAFASNHIIEATAEGEGTYEFQLDDGPFQDSGIFEDVTPGSHIVTIRDINGCGSVEVAVSVIDYPRFVTPNQDGFNDRWNIIGIGQADPTAKIYIFDRYGKLLKQISPLSNGWNGVYNGSPLPSSDYWFLVEYTEDETRKQFRGHFTLKR